MTKSIQNEQPRNDLEAITVYFTRGLIQKAILLSWINRRISGKLIRTLSFIHPDQFIVLSLVKNYATLHNGDGILRAVVGCSEAVSPKEGNTLWHLYISSERDMGDDRTL